MQCIITINSLNLYHKKHGSCTLGGVHLTMFSHVNNQIYCVLLFFVTVFVIPSLWANLQKAL